MGTSAATNYFKTTYQDPVVGTSADYFAFFRDGGEAVAWKDAMAVADAVGGKVSAYKPVRSQGPWNQVSLVGYRDEADIIADIHAAENDSAESGRRNEELTMRYQWQSLGMRLKEE